MKKAARAEGTGGIGIVFKVSREGAMVVKSMIPTGSASRSNLVQVCSDLNRDSGYKKKRMFTVVLYAGGRCLTQDRWQEDAGQTSREDGVSRARRSRLRRRRAIPKAD